MVIYIYDFSLQSLKAMRTNSTFPRTSWSPLVHWLRRNKTCLPGFADNTGADQPALPRSLISSFIIRLFENIISKLDTSEHLFI